MIALSALHQHQCGGRRTGFTSGFETCPYCKDPIGPVPSFPVLAAEFLIRVKNTDKLVVGYDVLEIENSLLIAAPDGEFVVIRNGTNNTETILLPKRTRFSSSNDYAIYAGLFDCARPEPGEVRILSPAVVEELAGGWRARERGRLEIVVADQTPEALEFSGRVPHSVDDFLKSNDDLITQTNEGWRQSRNGELEVHSGSNAPSLPSNAEPEPVKNEQNRLTQEFVQARPIHQRRLRLVLGIIASLVLLTAVIMGIHSSPEPIQNNHANATASPPINMIRVQGGEFQMGNYAGDEYEKPAHRVNVKSFFIDANEVTCEEYLKFARATNHRIPANWVNGHYPDGTANQPVTGVDWDDASAYARWIGKRLPTEDEWEFAARGTDGRLYPWGNEWRSNAANAGNSSAGRFTDVGSYPDGKSPFGAMDMVGNAWEWTASEWKGYPGGPVPADASNELRVIRGGFFGSSIPKATTTFRRGWDARGSKEGYRNTGFRCAKDL